MLLHEIVTAAAAAAPERTALVVDDEVTTFAELDERVAALAAAIREHAGVGDRIVFVGDNGPEWIDAYYGVSRAGCRLGFVNHRLGPVPLRAAIERLRPAVLIADRTRLDLLEKAAGPPLAPTVVVLDEPKVEAGERSYADLLEAGRSAPRSAPRPEADVMADDVAWLIATSGTSGTPKVVQLTHRNLLAAVRNTAAVRSIGPDDAFLTPFPLCHVAGYNVLLFHHAARPVVVARRFTPAGVLEQIDRHEVTTVSLAPTMIHGIVEHLGAAGGEVPASLRAITYGSSGIAPSLLADADEVLGADLHQGYGMTELGGNAVFLGPEEHRRGLAGEPDLLTRAGRPGPLVEVRLLDDDGAEVPPGERGEVAVRGEQVTPGYWEAPEANAEAFEGGWLRTGDVGCFDDEGLLSIVDRKKDIIVSGGENVSSRAVEHALVAHTDVAEAAVVGAPDERWGELVCAFVVARPGAEITEDEVLAFGREVVGGFQQPRRALVVDALPRNATGKVLKHELRAQLAGRGAATSA
jgi:acyl-CoA synthetase (AMP-forming)/AMP-acid ligase II